MHRARPPADSSHKCSYHNKPQWIPNSLQGQWNPNSFQGLTPKCFSCTSRDKLCWLDSFKNNWVCNSSRCNNTLSSLVCRLYRVPKSSSSTSSSPLSSNTLDINRTKTRMKSGSTSRTSSTKREFQTKDTIGMIINKILETMNHHKTKTRHKNPPRCQETRIGRWTKLKINQSKRTLNKV